MDYSNKSITLNGKEYIVIEQMNYDNRIYVYLSNDANPLDTMFAEIRNNEVFQIEPKLFQEKIFPLFVEKIKKDGSN